MHNIYKSGKVKKDLRKRKERKVKMEKNWFSKETSQIAEELKTNISEGLTTSQVEEKRNEFGFNELKAKKKKSLFVKFL